MPTCSLRSKRARLSRAHHAAARSSASRSSQVPQSFAVIKSGDSRRPRTPLRTVATVLDSATLREVEMKRRAACILGSGALGALLAVSLAHAQGGWG